MSRKDIEELSDADIVELYKEIKDFIVFLEIEIIGDNNAKWI